MSATAETLEPEIPYTVEPHPVTGVYNGKLGMWTFLASEVMLFGGLFSAYVLLRVGAAEWDVTPLHASVLFAAVNTAVLIFSSVAVVMAWAHSKMGEKGKARMWLLITIACAAVFMVIKFFEYSHHIAVGEVPSHSNVFAVYYTVTGLHGLHVLGGIVVAAYLAGPGAKLFDRNQAWYTNRLECFGLYWHFVDLVWIFLFPSLYLL